MEISQYDKKNATAICLDIREFTPTLSKNIKNGKENAFYEFLKRVYQLGYNLAYELTNDESKFYINSTGDGFICVFFDELHYFNGYFMGLALLHDVLELTKDAKKDLTFVCKNKFKFGVGIDSGSVVQVRTNNPHRYLESYIGDAINLAARIEAKTKEYENTPVIYGSHLNDLLCRKLWNQSYDTMAVFAKSEPDAADRGELNQSMNEFNYLMISDFLHSHVIKGSKPERLYKISISDFFNTELDEFALLKSKNLPQKYINFFKKHR